MVCDAVREARVKIIVLAGTQEQFECFAKGDKTYISGYSAHHLRGYTADQVIEIGTFYKREDADELRQIAQMCVRSA